MANPALAHHTPTAELPPPKYWDIPPGAPASDPRSRRLTTIAAIAAIVVIFGLLAAVIVQRRSTMPTSAEAPAIFSVENDGWRYVFHAPTGAESLFLLAGDPKCRTNVIDAHPERASDLRQEMLKRAGAEDLETLRDPHRQTIEALKSLGYL